MSYRRWFSSIVLNLLCRPYLQPEPIENKMDYDFICVVTIGFLFFPVERFSKAFLEQHSFL